MKRVFGISAVLSLSLATASMVMAGGEGDDRPGSGGFVTGTQAKVSQVIEDLARRADSVLGGEKALDERTGSYILLRGFFSERYGSDPSAGAETKAQIALPLTERKLRIEINTRSTPDVLANGTKPVESPSSEKAGLDSGETETLRAGIIAELLRSDQMAASAGVGVKVSTDPDLFLKGHLGFSRGLGMGWGLKAGETAYWYVDDGPESRTMLALERALGEDTIFHSTSAVLWTGKDRIWNLAEFLSLAHSIDPDTGVVFRAGETWSYKNGFRREEYLADAGLRRRLYGDWLFLEWRSGVSWPRDRGFSPTPVSTIWLDVFFGEGR